VTIGRGLVAGRERRARWFAFGRGTSFVVLLLAAIATGWIDRDPTHDQRVLEGAVRATCGFFALVVFYFMLRGLRDKDRSSNRSEDPIYEPDLIWLTDLQEATADSSVEGKPGRVFTEDDYGVITTFINLLTEPADYRSRVVESIELDGESIRQRVSVEYMLPDVELGNSSAVLIPVMSPRKDELVDKFDLRDANGGSLVDLSYEETTRLAAVGLRMLLRGTLDFLNGTSDGPTLGAPTPVPASDGKASQQAQSEEQLENHLILAVLEVLAARGRIPPEVAAAVGKPTTQEEGDPTLSTPDKVQSVETALLAIIAKRGSTDAKTVDAQIEKVLNRLPGAQSAGDMALLRRYVKNLASAYPIVAATPRSSIVGRRVLIKYERTLISPPRAKSWKDPVRIALGLRPSQVTVPLDLSLAAKSYHLHVNSPPDQHLKAQSFRCRHCGGRVSRSWKGTEEQSGPTLECRHDIGNQDDCHFTLRHRGGQNFAHLYMRGYGDREVPLRDLELLARFDETPPGSMGQALIASMAATALIGVVGYLISENRVPGGLPSLLLALPAVAASFFGFVTESAAVLRSALTARISFILTGTLSIVSAAIFLVQPQSHHIPLAVAGVRHPVWLSLGLLSLFNTLYVLWQFVVRFVQYRRLVRKGDIPRTISTPLASEQKG